jgi:hypothetical protein
LTSLPTTPDRMTSTIRTFHGYLIMFADDRAPGERSYNRGFELMVDLDGTGVLSIGLPPASLDEIFEGEGRVVRIDPATTASLLAAIEGNPE